MTLRKVKANPPPSDHFARVANVYDENIHNDEHELSLRLISVYVERLHLTSALDVGTGTGRGLQYFLSHHPTLRLYAIEPVDEMRQQAIAKGIPAELIGGGVGQQLPFPDNSFDAVTAFGVMHHAERPADIIKEMCRVAKRAVFVSDSNRFGQGSKAARLIKLVSWQSGFWPLLNLINTRGKGHHISESDGLFYSYSVYDNLRQLSEWANQVALIPIQSSGRSALNPLLTASHILVAAVKDSSLS
jgi:ubiquinone/menaquinone biosynthesis C-methylase UbiE